MMDAMVKIDNENLKNVFLNKEVLIYEETENIKRIYSKDEWVKTL